MNMQTLIDEFAELWAEAVTVWTGGGWAMWAIAAIALVMFAMGLHVWLGLRARGFDAVPESNWRRWVERPREGRGPVGELIRTATRDRSLKGMSKTFAGLQAAETTPFERDLKVMKVCVSAAPLVGLLGTVTGMLSTFGALATGSGGDQTMGLVAAGISEALITTETGLVIALPGLFFQYQLTRKFERYRAFLAQLQTVCAQSIHRSGGRARELEVRRAAMAEVAKLLQGRLGELGPKAPDAWPLSEELPATAGASS